MSTAIGHQPMTARKSHTTRQTRLPASDQQHPSGSIKAQLATWHADRGDKSFLRAMIPTWKNNNHGVIITKNPIKLIMMPTGRAWLLFFAGWLAWTCDGCDYFAVSLTVARLSAQFKVGTQAITTAITLTLLFRSLGALIFGVLADRFGRKWTLVFNLLLIAVFELGSGLCNTYKQFLAVRSLFGIAMGGIWVRRQPLHWRTSLLPQEASSLVFFSRVMPLYLLPAVINLTVVEYNKYHWRSLYFIGCGLSCAAAIVRASFPESLQFLLALEEAKTNGLTSGEATRNFLREMKIMLKTNWLRCIWGVCMMTGFNFFSHGSQDLYPTYLQTTKHFSSQLASKATIISNVGAIVGGTIAGYASQYVGRRLAIVICCLYTACWIPLWVLPTSFGGLSAGGFFIQSGVQGAWGVVPIYLGEVAPPAFRASFAGLAYQLGNAASAGSAQIEADAGTSLTIKFDGKVIPDYATILGILVGVVIAWMLLCVILGPEADGSHFEQAKVVMQQGAGGTTTSGLLEGQSEAKRSEERVEGA